MKGDTVKIIAMSDTHDVHHKINIETLPEADIFIHAGDFTKFSTQQQLGRFRQFLQRLPYKHKVVIAGNHDFALDFEIYESSYKQTKHKHCNFDHRQQKQKLKSVCTYLEHEEVVIEGLRIFGSPYTPEFHSWGFMYKAEDAQKLWTAIPQKVDVLITHGPPYQILDATKFGDDAGCKGLLSKIKQVKPKVHIFGHIHEGFGQKEVDGTRFYNASSVNFHYQLKNEYTLIEVERD